LGRIIDITQDGYHLSRNRGFMIIKCSHDEVARVPLDDIHAVIVHAHGITYTNSLLVELALRGAVLVLCGNNHFPIAILGATDGHHAQAGRVEDQISASLPLKKQLWKSITVQKIRMQGATLKAYGKNDARLLMLARAVKSGDPTNVEATAARHYWPSLMGPGFIRDRSLDDENTLLNYGYTILRAAVARSIIASGLHPSIGLHHQNRRNSFCLADDLIEPFRPLVDYTVRKLMDENIVQIEVKSKRALAAVLEFEIDIDNCRSSVTTAIQQLCRSLALSFNQGRANLTFAKIPQPIEFSGLMLRHGLQE